MSETRPTAAATVSPAGFLATASGGVEFLGRALTVGHISGRAAAVAAALAQDGVGPGSTVALLLPGSPGLVAACFAVLRLGGRPQLLDPAAGLEAQAAALRRSGAGLLLTFDLRALIDRALALVAAGEPSELRVGLLRASEELPFPRNLLEPLLRGGRFGQRPAHPAFFRLTPARPRRETLAAAGGDPGPTAAAGPGRLLLSDGEAGFAELLALPPAEAAGLPLHSRRGFAALLAALRDGGSHRLASRPLGSPAA